MAHHQVDLLLGVWVHGLPLGDYAADELVVVLAGALLLALPRVAVEDLAEDLTRAGVHLDGARVRELAAIVGDEDREEACIGVVAEQRAQAVEHSHHRGRVVAVPDEGEHQPAVREMDGEQALLLHALLPLDGVHLDDGHIGVLLPEGEVVGIGPADPAGLVLLHVLLAALLPLLVAHLAGQVEVADSVEDACIYIGVDGLGAVADGLLTDRPDDVVDGLPLGDPRLEGGAELHRLVLADDETRAASAQCMLVLRLRLLRPVYMLLQIAVWPARASVAHIWWLLQLHAPLPHIGRAQTGHAEGGAVAATGLFASVVGALTVRDSAIVLVQTVVVAFALASCPLDHETAPHFTRHRRAVLAYIFGYLLETLRLVQSGLYSHPVR